MWGLLPFFGFVALRSFIAALERRDEEGAELALRYDLNAAFSAIVPQLPA